MKIVQFFWDIPWVSPMSVPFILFSLQRLFFSIHASSQEPRFRSNIRTVGCDITEFKIDPGIKILEVGHEMPAVLVIPAQTGTDLFQSRKILQEPFPVALRDPTLIKSQLL